MGRRAYDLERRDELGSAVLPQQHANAGLETRLMPVDAGFPSTGLERIVGSTEIIRRLRQTITSVARSDAPVLVAGESGAGKELVVQALHEASARRAFPLLAVNCGAFNENLLMAELFGAARGAYTGATSARDGLIASADGGTLLLDEVGEMPPAMQVALLRVLETSEVRAIGSTHVRKVNVRIVTATHRNLADLARKGLFRDDLRYRIEVVRLEVPPLRERLDDIPELCEHLLGEVHRRYGIPRCSVSIDALRALKAQAWPGNVRELLHVLASAALAASGREITAADLPPEPSAPQDELRRAVNLSVDGHAARADDIRRALRAAAGHRSRAAQLLGLSRATLYRYLKTYEIDASEFDRPSS